MGLAVMKPVRTGFLANLPQPMHDALASTGIHKPDAEWALDYLWDIPEVSVAVSGMGSMADVEENLKYAAKAKPNMLTPAEREALGKAIYAYRHAPGHIDCTGCYQCIPCPHNVAIGYIFAYVYNNYLLHRNKERAMADVACAARRPGILVRRLWRMSGEVPAASGYSRSVGEGEGNNGKIILASLPDFPYLSKRNNQQKYEYH